jgi:hypothetical protein
MKLKKRPGLTGAVELSEKKMVPKHELHEIEIKVLPNYCC